MFTVKKEQLILAVILLTFIIGISLLIWYRHSGQEIIFTGQGEESPLDFEQVYKEDARETPPSKGEEEKIIYLHVAGEVNKPGVYQLPVGARVIDAVKAAGGRTRLADLDSINLAVLISDGQRIYIPSISETDYFYQEGSDNSVEYDNGFSSNNQGKININTASIEELQQLTGIGPGKASRIIDYREKMGRFTQLEELLEVNGIGPKTLENIKEEISI